MRMSAEPLNRENIDEFFHMYASHAYRSAYRILGDTTRTENALTESFLEVYHKRNSEEAEDPVFLFSDVLQRRVNALASQYAVTDTRSRQNDRVLDEFTENSILSEIHRKIDSASFRLIELITSNSVGRSSLQTDPVLGQIQNAGISPVLIIQLIVVGLLIFIITFAGAKSVFGINDLAPQSPNSKELQIEDLLAPVLNYLPLDTLVQPTGADAGAIDPNATTAISATGDSTSAGDTTTAITGSDESEPSATRG